MKPNKLNRRQLFKVGAGTALGLATSKALGSTCGEKTPDQPLGPFFPRQDTPKTPIREIKDPDTPLHLANDSDLTWIQGKEEGLAQGQQCLVTGKLTNQSCEPVPEATIVIWQATHTGLYNHVGDSRNESFSHPVTGETIQRKHDPNFQYWGKAITDAEGKYVFKTIVPGFYPADLANGWYRPPHIHFLISATGYPQLVTQMYFRGPLIEDNEFIQELNQRDFLLQNSELSEAERQSLIVDFDLNSENPEPILEGQFDLTLKR